MGSTKVHEQICTPLQLNGVLSEKAKNDYFYNKSIFYHVGFMIFDKKQSSGNDQFPAVAIQQSVQRIKYLSIYPKLAEIDNLMERIKQDFKMELPWIFIFAYVGGPQV